MREQSLESLDLNALNLFKKTERAMSEGYFHYASALAISLVNRYPNIPSLRLLLRQSAVGQNPKSESPITVYPKAFFHRLLFKANHRLFNYLNELELLLCKAPDNQWVHHLFADAAKAGELWQTAALSYETLTVLQPRNSIYMVELAVCLLRLGKIEDAQSYISKALELSPANVQANELLKEASVAQTLSSDAWNK